jgi:hypothetical protein
VDSLFHAFAGLHFEFAEQFLVGLLPIALTVVVHGQAMRGVGRYYRRYVGHGAKGSDASSRAIAPIVIVGIILIAHFLEVSGWAVFYVASGLIGDARSAMNFSIDAYTTLGGSNITLPLRWQGIDGLESMTAMLMFGWSTAVLATAMKSEFI